VKHRELTEKIIDCAYRVYNRSFLLAAIVALERTFFVAESHSHKRDFDEDLHDEF
jgi:hypothetical protein